ncbi:MAG: hypothetical protein JSS27_02995 [Planctomycetes bacterium]|nr:hypothetical protein [Planctomycetota bacterium]
MPFQFYCPQGHLLQGDESQMGQQSQCPMCGSMFVIPVMQGAGYGQPGMQPGMQPGGFTPPGVFPGMQPAQQQAPAAPAPQQQAPPPEPPKPAEPEKPPEPQIVRIPCPNGHVLETPSDMFGQQALCPYCNVQFELRFEDSQEYKHQQADEKRRKEEDFNAALLKWSIRIAIFVGVMFVGMFIYMMVKGGGE